MGLFAGAVKRLKNSWGNIGKTLGNALTLAGKSGIPGFFVPMGLGSAVNTAVEKLGKSTYDTGRVILGEINTDEYVDSLAETNKYGFVFGPYNAYKTIQEYGVKDGVKKVIEDNIEYGKEFLPMGGNPEKYITNILNKADDVMADVLDLNSTIPTQNYITQSSAHRAMQSSANRATQSSINDSARQKINNFINSTQQTNKKSSPQKTNTKQTNDDVMYKIANFINSVNK